MEPQLNDINPSECVKQCVKCILLTTRLTEACDVSTVANGTKSSVMELTQNGKEQKIIETNLELNQNTHGI